jgi:hypothetical protein
LNGAREVLKTIEQMDMDDGTARLRRLEPAVRLEVAIAEAEAEIEKCSGNELDPLFRLQIRRWAMGNDDLAALVPLRDPSLRILEFDYDVSAFRGARTLSELPDVLGPGPSHLVVFLRGSTGREREPLLVDPMTAQILRLSDGTRTVSDVVAALPLKSDPAGQEYRLAWIEELFRRGLLWLQNASSRIPTQETAAMPEVSAGASR